MQLLTLLCFCYVWADQNCCLKHVDEEEKAECIFFKQGFCRHGPACRFRHIKRPPDACPETADFSLGVSPLYGVGDNPAASQTGKKRKVAAPNQYYKIIMCKHWLHTGHCPYGEDCHYGKLLVIVARLLLCVHCRLLTRVAKFLLQRTARPSCCLTLAQTSWKRRRTQRQPPSLTRIARS